MIGRTISRYRILTKLGEGGVGAVYKAEDRRLGRIVALKFLLPKAVGNQERKARFLREARTAAALDHPNICTVYEIDETEGQVFIAMAYIEGQTLQERIRDPGLAVDEAVHVAVQVARGLEAAHAKGILHRDVKSANIMISPSGLARITDFGLAKARGALDVSTTTLDIGTPAYMSPEQVRGESLDLGTDIWSWGVVFYEMLTRRLPFEADNLATLVHGILDEEPPAPSSVNPAVPPVLDRIVERALAKRRGERYRNDAELLADLEAPAESTTASGPRRLPLPRPPGRPSVAVLAFTDMSPEQDQEYFCDGVADEIINDLSHVEGLRVAARTSAFAFKGRALDIREIGRKLGVDTVLEGSVRKAGDRLRITGQLVSVADGYHLWSEQYDRKLEDVFAIQEEIAHSITRALEVELSEREQRALSKVERPDLEAYELYLKGRQAFYRSKRESIDTAIELFRQAVRQDPGFARAYAGMADCYSYLFMYYGREDQHLRLADEASRKALELHQQLAEGHAARGLALSLEKRWDDAEEHLRRAAELNPNLYEAYYFHGRVCFSQGKFEEAVEWYEGACRVNPDDYQAPSLLAFTLRTLGRMDEAREVYGRAVRAAEKHLELHPDDARAIYLGAQALVVMGERERGLQWANRALAFDPHDPYNLYGQACFFAQYGNLDQALSYLEQAVRAGFRHREWAENDIDLDPIREHPRFTALLREMDAGGDPG